MNSLPPGTQWNPKTGDGKFRAQRFGEDVTRRFKAKSLAEVEKLWTRFRKEVVAMKEAGTPPSHLVRRPPPENLVSPTLNEYLDSYWPSIEARHAEKTKDENKYRIAALRTVKVSPTATLGDTRLDVISTPMLKDAVAAWTKEYAPPTINGYLQILKRVIIDAHERRNPKGGRILKEVSVGEWPMETEKKLKLELQPDERQRLLEVFAREDAFRLDRFNKSSAKGKQAKHLPWRSHWDRFRGVGHVIVVALETGLRKGDLLDLRWNEVFLEEMEVRRLQNKSKDEDREPVVIALSPLARDAFLALAGARLRVLKGSPQRVCDGYGEGRIVRSWALAKELAKITRRLRWHDLRHSFGSNLIALGAPILAVRDMMGHASIDSTQRYARPGVQGVATIKALVNPSPESVTNDNRAQVTDSAKEDTPAPSVK